MTRAQLAGVLSYGAYLPYHRLDRVAIANALGAPAGHGTRAVASFDEDATSMAVEAGRVALAAAASGTTVGGVLFATTSPPYADKTNATAIHAALRLPSQAVAIDLVGSVRNATSALRMAAEGPGTRLVVSADVRVGRPGSVDEREGGDAAAAFLIGTAGETLADFIGVGAATVEVLERWRLPTDVTSSMWEERFGEHAYASLVTDAATDAIKQAGVAADAVDRWVVTGLHTRAVRAAAKALASFGGDVAADLTGAVGNTGAAHPGLALAAALDEAEPGHVVGLVSLADGADVLLLRVNDAITDFRGRPGRTVVQQVAAGNAALPYTTYLTWRGQLDREPPRRPDPKRPAPPPTLRNVDWKFGLVATKCTACGTTTLPAQRVCVACHAVDQMEPAPMADVAATVATYTIDRLTYSLSPPVVAAVLDFEGGGRFTCELTDVDPAEVEIGLQVEMTFRRLYTSAGVHNYFWKARPVRGAQA